MVDHFDECVWRRLICSKQKTTIRHGGRHMLKRMTFVLVPCLMILMSISAFAQCPTLVWSDEFNGTSVDLNNWTFEEGGGGWGNNELQYHRAQNATVEGGVLKITAKQENYRGKQYTSSRMRSYQKADFFYGRFEARIKIPVGQGIWPAFWMMPTDELYGTWPASGEIDIMENVGHEESRIHGTIHYGPDWQGRQNSGSGYDLYNGERFTDDFHVFAVEKTPDEIRWYVDDVLYFSRTPSDIAPEFWPFNEQFYFILNVAVGGNWPGSPDATTVFPQVMEVDYVRVYDLNYPNINGNRDVKNQEAGVTYSILDAPAGTSYNWSVPAGAQIASGQGTDTVTVNWGDTSGEVVANLSSSCGSSQVSIDVYVNPPVNYESSLENFDDPATVTSTYMDGTLTEITNPDTSGINSSALSGEYVRNSGAQYDVIAYNTASITNGADFTSRVKRFYIDVYTTAPAGSVVLFQLEDSSLAVPDNFPTGRHSRYQALTTIQNGWERLEVNFLDIPDGATSDTSLDTLVVLFQPNSTSGDTWIFDNLDIYTTQTSSNPPATPGNLTASAAGSAQIDLTWSDNANDEDGFKIERSTDGVNFSQVATAGANASSYSDSGLSASTTYYYRVRAHNGSGDSAYSNTANATTDSVGSATTMYVSAIVTGTQGAGRGQKYGKVTVTILDNTGAPVAGATVSGDFSGTFNESGSGVTGADGTVEILTSSSAGGNVSVSFCVTNVTHASLIYDSASNASTCAP